MTRPFDIDAESDDVERIESEADVFARYMAALGFAPKTALDPSTFEYYKTFSDGGKVGRVVAVVGRDVVGLTPTRPEYFTLTVQIHIPADDVSIRTKAPAYVKDDMLRILAHFADLDKRTDPNTGTCIACGMLTADLVETSVGTSCFDCARRIGLT